MFALDFNLFRRILVRVERFAHGLHVSRLGIIQDEYSLDLLNEKIFLSIFHTQHSS